MRGEGGLAILRASDECVGVRTGWYSFGLNSCWGVEGFLVGTEAMWSEQRRSRFLAAHGCASGLPRSP
jgi:hypothetical protein